LEQAATTGLRQILAEIRRWGKKVNGWRMTFTGKYGTDYLLLAVTAFVGLGPNLPRDAIYPMATTDGNGQRLNGANKHVLHFEQGASSKCFLVLDHVQRPISWLKTPSTSSR
jgi:hypothetical protein